MKMEVMRSSEKSVHIRTSWYYIPEDDNILLEGITIEKSQGSSVLTVIKAEEAIKKLNTTNAPGMDRRQAELVKYAGPEYVKQLHQQMFVKSFQRNGILSTVCLIRAKGDVMVCSNYRGIGINLL
jgi:hypothetical protein